MTAGEALDRDNVAGFNCSYLPIDHPQGFRRDDVRLDVWYRRGLQRRASIRTANCQKWRRHSMQPTQLLMLQIRRSDGRNRLGSWYHCCIQVKFPNGTLAELDLQVPRSRVFGGRASGPEPLLELFHSQLNSFKGAAGRNLASVECHDLCCKIAQIVVVGGVRRSALISLSNLTDDRLRRCKHGQWWVDEPPTRIS